MCKEEAKLYIPNICNLINNNIKQLLDSDIILGDISFYYLKDNDENKIVFDIKVPINKYERNYNTNISIKYSDLFFEELLKSFLVSSLEKYEFIITKIKKSDYNTLKISNINGSELRINFFYNFDNIEKLIENYNNKIDEYLNSNRLTLKRK
ncbi:MAG: hypothetical protein IJD92_03920 [Bacilli bacterium]|nr:hypothetical protein [Bacilli bacterium]